MGADALEMIAASKKVVTAEYHRPWETHARMEPINATVSVTDSRVDVWSPTQDQSVALMLAADQASRDPKEVFVHTVFLGGGFGGGGGGNTAVTRQATETLAPARTTRQGDLVARRRHRAGQAAPAAT